MAGTFGEARAMAEACAKNGVQLTFNHQRRFNNPFQTAKKLVESGEIGELKRIEGCCGNMLDWGTHWLNMFLMLNRESKPVWVMGQVDVRADVKIFGVPHDTDGVCVVGFENGVRGTLHTGQLAEDKLGLSIQLYGSERNDRNYQQCAAPDRHNGERATDDRGAGDRGAACTAARRTRST